MSLIRDPAIITKVGRQMMTAGGDITYTKATLYGQEISHLTKDQLESLTSIGNPLMTVPVGISDKSDNGNGTTIVLEATFQNTNLKTDLPYTAVGFFAKKGEDEKLVLVGVANAGAYLAATRPDGVATDALDLKVAIAIGDATNVTAVVDPAGSVTPATLNGAINKATHDLTAEIDTKADKTTVESELAIKANSTDVDKKLDTKANSSDVYTKKQVDDAFSSRDATIATKADKATVDAEISKIDFTPYAKTADVNKEIKTVTDLANTKVGTDYSYSKAELDKKLLALSTDTSGKVDANQVATMIEGKADAADVNKQIKAVTDLANTKANTVDVDSKIKTVTDLANTKANSADVYTKNETDSRIDEAKNTVQSNLDSVKKELNTTINTKANSDDVYNRSTVDNAFTEVRGRLSKLEGTQTLDSPDFNGITASGVYYITNNNGANIKNNPVDQWGVLIVSNDDGHRVSQVYYPDDGNPPWYRSLDESTWRSWYQLSTRNDVTNSANAASNKVDTVLTNSYVRKQGMNQNGDLVEIKHAGVKQDNGGYAFDMWSDDWTAEKVHEVLGQLPNKANLSDVSALQSKVNVDGPLFKHLTQFNNWGDLFDGYSVNGVTATNGNRLVAFRDDTNSPNLVGGNSSGIGFGGGDTKSYLSVSYGQHRAIIGGGNGNAPVWHEEVAWKSDINSLLNTINQQNQTIQSLTTRLTNAENEINYIKANYVEGRRFPASQEAQANSWENENPQRIAFIER